MLFLQAHDDHTEFLCEEADPSNQKACTNLPISVSGDIKDKGMGNHHRVVSHKLRLLLDPFPTSKPTTGILLLEIYVAIRTEMCLLNDELLKSEMSLKGQTAPASVLCSRTSDSVHAVCAPKQREIRCPRGTAFPVSAGPGQPQEKVHGNQRRKG